MNDSISPAPAARHDLLILGDCNPDLVVRGHELSPRDGQVEQLVDAVDLTVGGSASITACAAARLGTETSLWSAVGADDFGDMMLRQLRERGVRTEGVRRDPQAQTAASVVLSDGPHRTTLTFPGVLPTLRASQVEPAALRTAAHLHVSSFFLLPGVQEDLADLLRLARAEGVSTSLDPGWDPHERWDGVDELLGLLDLVLPNEQEALLLTGERDARSAARALSRYGADVVVKLGAHGALVLAGGHETAVTAPAVEAVDTTGAGDTFAGALLAWRLLGEDLATGARAGCAAGALSTRHSGGVAGQPSGGEVERAMHGSER